MDNFDILNDEEDFEWYKISLDLDRRYAHKHNNTPREYPCKVRSEYWDNPNGPFTYNHFFQYKIIKTEVCDSCGHTVNITVYWE